jgi:hypothetical protein
MAIKVTELKKALREFEQKELINLLTELYKLNGDVKEYLSIKFSGEEAIDELYMKTKKKITDEFFPDKGFGKMRLAEAKKAISNFQKITDHRVKAIDLMLYYVEIGTEFTNTYGDIDERFYNSMNSMYNKVADECDKDVEMFNSLKERLYSVVEESDGIGWGYHDDLANRYYSIKWINKDNADDVLELC